MLLCKMANGHPKEDLARLRHLERHTDNTREIPHRPRDFKPGWGEELVKSSVCDYWRYDVREPENMWRVADYYDCRKDWDDWYGVNKKTANKMKCFMQLLLIKARNANKGKGMSALDGSPIEGMHRTHSHTMARGATLMNWGIGVYQKANTLNYDVFHENGCMRKVTAVNESSIPTIEQAILRNVYGSESKEITVTIQYMNKSWEDVSSKTLLEGCRERSTEESRSKKESAKPMPFSMAYSKVKALHSKLTKMDIICPIPTFNLDKFKNETTLDFDKKSLAQLLTNSRGDIADILKVPQVMRTLASRNFFSDPLDPSKYKEYVKQYEMTVTFRKQEHRSVPPYVISNRSLASSAKGYLSPDQINLSILLPIIAACIYNNGCPDEKPPKESQYFKELVQLLVWSACIITNEDRNRVKTHSIIHHYEMLANSSCYLSTNDSLGGIIMMAELFLSAFHVKTKAEEPFHIDADQDNDELKIDPQSYNTVRSYMDQMMSNCKDVFGKSHLDNRHISQKDRLRNLGKFILVRSFDILFPLLTILYRYYSCGS